MKAYIASGWFNKEQEKDLDLILYTLKECFNFDIFSPRDDCLCPPSADEETKANTFNRNLSEIENCDFVICNTRGKDMGTLFEAGYAYKCKKPIVYVCFGMGDGFKFNLMLAKSGVAVATGIGGLVEILDSIEDNKGFNNLTQYTGVIE